MVGGLFEHQHVLILEEGLARDAAETGGACVADHPLGIDALVHRRPGPAAVLRESTMPMRPFGLATSRQLRSSSDRLLHLVVRVDDQDGVDGAPGQSRVVGVPSTVVTRFLQPSARRGLVIASIIWGWMSSAIDACRSARRDGRAES